MNFKNIMGNKIHILRFRKVNKDTFQAIKNGKKKIETRAATSKYKNIKTRDTLKFVCGNKSFTKKVKKVEFFKTLEQMLKTHKPKEINPFIKTAKDLERMYHGFPNYKEKLKKYGLMAFKLG